MSQSLSLVVCPSQKNLSKLNVKPVIVTYSVISRDVDGMVNVRRRTKSSAIGSRTNF